MQAYDPAFAYEVGAIVRSGIERMYGSDSRENGGELDPDVMYYITLYNENYTMPALPEGKETEFEQGAVRGLYRWADGARRPVEAGDDPVLGHLPHRRPRGGRRPRRAL